MDTLNRPNNDLGDFKVIWNVRLTLPYNSLHTLVMCKEVFLMLAIAVHTDQGGKLPVNDFASPLS